MRRVYISFLGTNDYLPCTYHEETGGEGNGVKDARFVQQATLFLKCRDWADHDRGYIFTTPEAETINWVDGGCEKPDSEEPATGLQRCIKDLELPFAIDRVPIKSGFSKDEIWENFETVYGVFQSGDAVTFDITHAFRSIPMLAIAVLNYARVMKKVRLEGIYYGAFEVLGSYKQARAMAPEQRQVPILDLTPLDLLMRWSLALDRFVGSGDAQSLADLAIEAVNPVLAETKGADKAAQSIRSISKRVADYTAAMATCRGKEILPITQALKKELDKFQRLDLIPPFQPLFSRLREEFQPFCADTLKDGIQSARWCLEHNLTQQGVTILREVLLSYIALLVPPELSEKDQRGIASSAFGLKAQKKPQVDWKGNAGKYPEITQRYINLLDGQEDLVKVFNELSDYRNDLNHAGFRDDAKRADRFGKKLKEFIDRSENFFRT